MYETLEHEHEDFLEMEHEHEDFLEMEDEDFLEMEHEDEFEDFLEMEDEDFLEMEHEHEDFLEMEHEFGGIGGILSSLLGGELAGPLHESEERELAAELLEVQTEDELEQFLGKLIKGAARGIGNFARSSTGKALGGILKGVAKKALPIVGGALGSMVAPGVGTAIGSKLGSLAGGLFEMEDEVGQGELEFEMARRVVRIGATAANRAALARPTAPPAVVARRAVLSATRAHAPAALPLSVQPRFRARRPIVVPGRPVATSRPVGYRPVARRVPVGTVHRPVGYRRPATTTRGRYGRPLYRSTPGYRTGYRPSPYGRYPRMRRATSYRTVAGGGAYGSPAVRRPGSARRPAGVESPVWRPARTGPGGRSGARAGWGSPAPARWSGGPVGWGGPSGWGSWDGWSGEPFRSTGTWVRRGDRIVVLGV